MRVWGEIESDRNYLGRQFGMHCMTKQSENINDTLDVTDSKDEEVGELKDYYTGYKLVVMEGIRINEVNKEAIIAALIPSKTLPLWFLVGKMPPVLILRANLGVYDATVLDVI